MNQSIEQELNEVRSLIAQASASVPKHVVRKLEEKLAALEERLATEGTGDPSEAKRAAILRALATAKNGKPGYLSSPQIEAACNMTKSEVHTHVNELEKKGRVWIRKTHGENGRPVFWIYDPRALGA